MALKDRVKRLEANEKVSPQLNAVVWWEQLLANPKENEHKINAAFFMALDGLIQKPPERLWKPLEDMLKQTWEELSDSLFAFCSFYSIEYCKDEEECALLKETFADDDGKEWLCLMASTFWEVFKTAPIPSMPEVAKHGAGRPRIVCLGNLRGDFLIPIFELIFTGPPYGYSYGLFESWLDKEGECESLLQSAREFMFGDKTT